MTPERQLDILTRTRDLISHPSRWGQGTFVQHPLIDRLMMRPPSLCLMAAVQQAATGDPESWNVEVMEIHNFLLALIDTSQLRCSAYNLGMMTWNDHHTHPELIALLDLAILETSYLLADANHPTPLAQQM